MAEELRYGLAIRGAVGKHTGLVYEPYIDVPGYVLRQIASSAPAALESLAQLKSGERPVMLQRTPNQASDAWRYRLHYANLDAQRHRLPSSLTHFAQFVMGLEAVTNPVEKDPRFRIEQFSGNRNANKAARGYALKATVAWPEIVPEDALLGAVRFVASTMDRVLPGANNDGKIVATLSREKGVSLSMPFVSGIPTISTTGDYDVVEPTYTMRSYGLREAVLPFRLLPAMIAAAHPEDVLRAT